MATGGVTSTLTAVTIDGQLGADTLRKHADTPAVFAPRFDGMVTATLPILLAALVPMTAIFLAVFFWHETALKHAIFAVHWWAFYFVLESLRQLFIMGLPSWAGPLELAAFVLQGLYLSIAMKIVYGRGWIGSVIRAIIGIVIFAMFLAAWLMSTIVLAGFLA